MEGRIHSDLFAQDRYILGAVPIKIKKVRSRNPFCLVSSADFKVILEEYVFRVRRVNVSSTTNLAHTQTLQHTTAKYPIDRINCKVFSVPNGNLSGNQANIFQGPLPVRVVIGMVDADAYNGTYTKNPFNFKNYDTTFLGLTVNGEHLPGKPFNSSSLAQLGQTTYRHFKCCTPGPTSCFRMRAMALLETSMPMATQCTCLI